MKFNHHSAVWTGLFALFTVAFGNDVTQTKV